LATASAAKKVDYKAIAAKKIRKPGLGHKRFLIYSRNKKGKTTLGASAPKTLVLDPERGAEELPENLDLWPIDKWDDMNDAFRFLRFGDHDYEWVNVDGLTRINNMALRYIMGQQEERDLDRIPGQVQQRDYGKSGELMKGMLFNFHTLPMGVVYTAQERQEIPGEFDSEDEDSEPADARFVPDLPKGVRSSVNAIVDCIGRLYTVKIEHPKTQELVVQRRLHIGTSEAFDTGIRSKFPMPDMIKNPTIPKLVELMNTGTITTARKKA
jgi:hypothetical protein